MLGKRSRPVNGKLPDPLVFGDRTSSPAVITSPKSPLDFKIRSPRGLKNCDLGGVGLGIVAALEKSGGCRGETPPKFIVGSLNLNRYDPIPVGSSKTMGYRENNIARDSKAGHDRSGFDRRCKNVGVFSESPPEYSQVFPAIPMSDFLSSCHLCRKKLHGQDIYMYRGEKAFCSTECRYRQIVNDERKEKCGSEASRSADMSGSPYARGQIFSTGIFAT
ncbi:hypothetical protein HHK36_025383 [Tetracentron sinense]|uniref:FLZ-type domain-containing protein n=1 Tax=Tetracentron sinense TaxID=13715 RepID=A0A834YL34_TETSI|nr:hypothetical protein HHK36_025383 [Tetracentron sinense]